MDLRDELRKAYEAACAAERELWLQVRGRHPGTPGHHQGQWDQWLAVAQRVRELAGRIRELGPP